MYRVIIFDNSAWPLRILIQWLLLKCHFAIFMSERGSTIDQRDSQCRDFAILLCRQAAPSYVDIARPWLDQRAKRLLMLDFPLLSLSLTEALIYDLIQGQQLFLGEGHEGLAPTIDRTFRHTVSIVMLNSGRQVEIVRLSLLGFLNERTHWGLLCTRACDCDRGHATLMLVGFLALLRLVVLLLDS